MKEKDLKVSLLYDFYSSLLSEKKRHVFEMYYFDDLSLAAISEHTGSTRQGVRELIVRTSDELYSYESALGLMKKDEEQRQRSKKLLEIAEKIEKEFPAEAQMLSEFCKQKGE
jgi:predicted DNA-binding protein YlxM (UPF0122 family)